MEFLSERVSFDRQDDRLSVVISPRPTSGQKTLLVLWVVAWTLCGIFIFYERRQLPAGEPLRQYLLAMLAFWAYFEIRVVRTLLWRLKGYELWRVKDGTFTIKDSILGFGSAHNYFIHNIQKLGLINIDQTSWKWQMDQSIWVIGGERLGFEHLGKKVVFGKALTDEEAQRLVLLLKKAFTEARKMEAKE